MSEANADVASPCAGVWKVGVDVAYLRSSRMNAAVSARSGEGAGEPGSTFYSSGVKRL